MAYKNAVYEEIKVKPSTEEDEDMRYEVSTPAVGIPGLRLRNESTHIETTPADVPPRLPKYRKASHSNKRVTVLFFLFVLLLCMIIGGYVGFALELSKWKSETAAVKASVSMLYSLLEGNGAGGQFPFYPADSCAALPPSSPSGYYWVRAFDNSAMSVYCDMTRSCGGVTGGWMRVAELDMRKSDSECPDGLIESENIEQESNTRTCVRNETSYGGCSIPSNFDTLGIEYSVVCGRVIGYQYGTTDAFTSTYSTIDSKYVDGVSLTHGDPRQHIWTFASANDEVGTSPSSNCPCINTNQAAQATPPPEFVGNDYFCDTGSEERHQVIFYGDDPLWDGAGCGPQNTCCSFNTPPWFYKQLPQPTTDDIEMRVCTSGDPIGNEDVAIEIVEIYIR